MVNIFHIGINLVYNEKARRTLPLTSIANVLSEHYQRAAMSGLIFLEERGKLNTLLGDVKQRKLPTLQEIISSQTVQEELQKRKVVDNLSQIRKYRGA